MRILFIGCIILRNFLPNGKYAMMSYTNEYRSIVRKDFEDWLKTGYCNTATKLNDAIGQEYFDISNPHYFTGDINAELVLVHLNPKRNKSDYKQKSKFSNFSEYWHFHANFGEYHYGETSTKTHKSPFDHKQIRFLKPFNIISFSETDIYYNLQRVIDKKLQIELIPYGSPNFEYDKINVKNIKEFIENTLKLISSSPRKYIIFCGKIFQQLLNPYITSHTDYNFKLAKKDGSETKNHYKFIKITLNIEEQIINAGIAPHFAIQGAPISSYGAMIANLYNSDSAQISKESDLIDRL